MKSSQRDTLNGILFISPWIIGFTVFMLYPLLASIYYSFCDYSVLRPPVYIGVKNYTTLFADELFHKALYNTFIYAVIALPLSAIVALALALLLNTKVKGMTFYRALFYVPSLVPAVAIGVLITWIFNGQHGVLNELLAPLLLFLSKILAPIFQFLHMLHVETPALPLKPPQWLGDTFWSKGTLIIMAAWGAGNAMVIYLAGLQDVPQQLYEAADLDGANWWSKTWNVTLPVISPVILFNVIMGMIGTLQVFTVPYLVSPSGSPDHSIYFYTMYLFDNAFMYHKMGYASAMGWIMFLVILALTFLSIRLSKRFVHYGAA